MKKRNIFLIFVAIVAAVCLTFFFWPWGKGYIKIDASGAAATLRLQHGPFSKTTINSDDQPAAVNVDLYYPQWLQLRGKENGDTWQIESRGPWGRLRNISVNKDETTALRLGPPLLVKSNVTSRGSQVFVGFSIIGQAGEQYGNVITKNGRRASTPESRIIDETGKTLAAGKFEYG